LEQAKRLWRGNQQVEVRPRPLSVLRYLAERPGQLLTGEELLKRLWPGIYVTKTVLRVCVHEVRQALREDSAVPRFIETVGRQGYRFIGSVVSGRSVASRPSPEATIQSLITDGSDQATYFVGRERELARLRAAFARTQRRERQMLLLSGEARIGKTTLADRFLDLVRTSGHACIGRGQCVEHYGSGEAYLPLLEALGQLCREVEGERILNVLRRYAPLWLAQLSGLLETDEQEAVRRQVQGSSRERMLRELAEAVEALAAESVLILILEDLQWCDVSTLEVLAYLAQRRQPAKLYILGTYRPTDVVVQEHPLRSIVQELAGRRQCEELPLELLTEVEVEEYLRQRFGQSPTLPALSQLIYRRTDGNALFVVSFVDYLLQQGLLSTADGQVEIRADLSTLQKFVPETIQQMIARQLERLPESEQQLLGVASVGGRAFTAAEVAGVVGRPLEDVEEVYDHLADREHFIAVVRIAEWPDDTVTACYKFRHALYQQVLYAIVRTKVRRR
jgi:predicted ATPase